MSNQTLRAEGRTNSPLKISSGAEIVRNLESPNEPILHNEKKRSSNLLANSCSSPHVVDTAEFDPPPAHIAEETSVDGTPKKEITVRGLVITLILGSIMASANAYLGLYIGLTISVSIPAAIIAVSALKPFGTTIQEINAIQTGSSAGSLISTGLIFSLPALIIIGYWDNIHWFESFVVLIIGGALGALFSIPIRRALIIEQPLRFPEGVATAEVLFTTLPPVMDENTEEYKKSRANTKKGLILLFIGAVIGAILKIGSSTFFLWDNVAAWGFWVNSAVFYFGVTLSPAVISIGYIIGIHPAVMMLTGSIICWWIATPLTMAMQDETYPDDIDAISVAFDVWGDSTRYIGIGAMLFGGLGTIFLLAKPIYNGIKSGIVAFSHFRKEGMKNIAQEDRDIPIPYIAACICLLWFPLFALCWYFTGIWYVGIFSSCFMLLFGFFFSCVGAYMAGLVGSSQNPISGVTLATVITAALILLLFLGFENPLGPPAAILIGAVICCASSISGDSMQDLKTGNIVGSTPWKQQIMQIVGILVPSLILPVVLSLILEAYGIGEPTDEHPEPLIAPQANLVADISHAIFFGGAPIWMVVIGSVLAIVIVITDLILMFIKSSFRLHVLSIALGLYLPFENNAAVFLGALVAVAANYTLQKAFPDDKQKQEENFRFGLLFSAGVITGEALAGIIFAIPIVISGDVYMLSLVGGAATEFWPGLLLIAMLLFSIYLVAVYPAISALRGMVPT